MDTGSNFSTTTPNSIPVPSNPSQANAVKYRISTTVKCVQGDNVRDATLQEILTNRVGRPDLRDPDTPMTGFNKVVSLLSSRPSFRDSSSGGKGKHGKVSAFAGAPAPQLGADCLNADSIVTPGAFASLMTEPITPASASVAPKVFKFLNQYWNSNSKSFEYRRNIQLVKEFDQAVVTLCAEAKQIFHKEPAMLRLPPDLFVLGDTHGNFEDLHYFMSELLLFRDIQLTHHSFLMLGDYVDRGEFSVECTMLCLALKCMSPSTFYMLRGNHEDPSINGDVGTYGSDCFFSQCQKLFGDIRGDALWTIFNGVFQEFPLAAIIDDKIFCSHGGIPRFYGTAENDDRLRLLSSPDFPRFHSLFEPLDMTLPKEQMERFWVAVFDLLWSDPTDGNSEVNQFGFGRNERGTSIVTFSEVAVDNFLGRLHLELMFRAHQEKSDGLKISKSAKCLTVFSSSNYQGHGNGAGIVYVGYNGVIKLITKEATEG